MDTVNIVLLLIIVLEITCNAVAITFIYLKESATTMKDKIITLFCLANISQAIGYIIELYAQLGGRISHTACVTAVFLICSLTYSSIGFIMLLVMDRSIAILRPFKYVIWTIRKRNIMWLPSPLLAGFALGLIPLVGWGSYGKSRHLTGSSTYCTFDFDINGTRSYLIFVVFVVMVIPTCVASVCFVLILRDLRKAATAAGHRFSIVSNIANQSRRNVLQQSISSALTGLVYFVSWIMYAIVCFMRYVELEVPVAFEYVAMYFAKSATVSCPVVYCLIEKRFRIFVRDIFCSKKRYVVASFEKYNSVDVQLNIEKNVS